MIKFLDGLQFYFVDVSTHPLFVSVFQQSTGLRFITIEVPFQSSLDLSIKKNATFFFTELNISNTTANTTLKQAFRSSNSTHVLIDIITEDDISWNGIKGYVAIYTQGPSKKNYFTYYQVIQILSLIFIALEMIQFFIIKAIQEGIIKMSHLKLYTHLIQMLKVF